MADDHRAADPWPPLFERALRRAVTAHDGQARKGSGEPPLPYASHVVAVAFLLQRAGFDETVVAAGLLHDVVEDTTTTIDAIRDEFGDRVADLVAACTESKTDEQGGRRPWGIRKREALDRLACAAVEARAVALADKLHNLLSIEFDLGEGRDVWSCFNAGRDAVLDYHREAASRWGGGDARLVVLAEACEHAIERIERISTT